MQSKIGKQRDVPTPGKTKSATHNTLLRLYERAGLTATLTVARELLTSDVRGKVRKDKIAEFKTEMNGELGEVVLEILIKDYCKTHPQQTKDWVWYKSLILKDPSSNSDFLTEVDFILATPECIYVFECKSYAGKKQLQGSGNLVRETGNNCDVYKQNLLHVRTLDKNLKRAVRKPVYRMVMFNFSNGELTDCRTETAKFSMPCVNERSWEQVLVKGAPVWNMKLVTAVLDSIEAASDRLRDKHLRYVKSIER